MQDLLDKVESTLREQPFPPSVNVETTSVCDLRCTMCGYPQMPRSKKHMKMELYRKVIDEVAQERPDCQVWLNFYGEPLLTGYRLFYQVEYAKKAGCRDVRMNTNATHLDDETADFLIDAGLDLIVLSMDGFSKDTYEKIRLGGKYDQVKANALRMIERARDRKAAKPEIQVQIIEMPDNQAEIEDFRRFWAAQGAVVKVKNLITWAGTLPITIQGAQNVSRIACPWIMNTCPVLYNGDVVICATDADGRHVLGNVENESIQSIWARKESARRAHMEHRWADLPEICKKCTDWCVTGSRLFGAKATEASRAVVDDSVVVRDPS